MRALSACSRRKVGTVGAMARPRLYHERRVATAIRLPVALREELRAAASARNVSANLLVTRAIQEYLERLGPHADDQE